MDSSADLSAKKGARHCFEKAFAKQASNPPHSPSYFQKIVAEFVGTYILIFVGCGSILIDRVATLSIVGIALVWSMVVIALVYSLGHISGAHLNPAVTIAFGVARKLPLLQVPMYVLSQFLGSGLACLTLSLLFNDQGDILPIVNQYKSPVTDLKAIVWEFMVTFILMFVVCGTASDDRANKALSGVAIGVTVLSNAIIAGPITGASMNPARSVGPAIVSGEYKNLWVYIVAPILGAVAAILIYGVLRAPTPVEDEKDDRAINNDLFLHSQV